MQKPPPNSSVMIIAGESSADLHGSELVEELSLRCPNLQLFGVGGPKMRSGGFEALIDAESMSLAGLTEVFFALPRMFRYMRLLLRAAIRRRPAVVVLIDLPDFNLRLAKRLKKYNIPVIYYISPQLWAWRKGRVEQIKKYVDRMLVILPFEKEFYDQAGVPVEFVGHPLVEELPLKPDPEAARRKLGISPGSKPVIALLPGSRKKEVSRHLPIMLRSVQLLKKRYPSLISVLPVANTIEPALVQSLVHAADVEVQIIQEQSTEVISAADAAIVCSGTTTLQTALLARPMVVVYRVSWLSYLVLKRLVKVAHIGLVNLIAQRRLVPELIQNSFTPENVCDEITFFLEHQSDTALLTRELEQLRETLGQGGTAKRVTDTILGFIPSASTGKTK